MQAWWPVHIKEARKVQILGLGVRYSIYVSYSYCYLSMFVEIGGFLQSFFISSSRSALKYKIKTFSDSVWSKHSMYNSNSHFFKDISSIHARVSIRGQQNEAKVYVAYYPAVWLNREFPGQACITLTHLPRGRRLHNLWRRLPRPSWPGWWTCRCHSCLAE